MGQIDERPLAGHTALREQIRSEIDDLTTKLDDLHAPLPWVAEDLDVAVVRRRTKTALAAVLAVLDSHPLNDDGRCSRCWRRQSCPAGEVQRVWAAGWLATGGLAERREGDPNAVSTRRLL